MSLGSLKTAVAIGLVCASAATAITTTALAKSPPAQADKKALTKEAIKVSQDIFKVMRDVRSTRIAIFNGRPDEAKKLITLAQVDINAAKKFAIDSKSKSATNDMYVPFDADLALSRTFVASPKNAEHIKKANEHLKKGERDQAISVLKFANIDISFTTASLPVKLADSRIKDAAKLIGSGKYYEANLVLKALEDSVVIDNVMADATSQKKG